MRRTPAGWLLAFLLVTPPATAQVPAFPLPVAPRNVVLIVADDVGVDLIGAYEPFFANYPHPAYPNRTPVLDSLAARGITFRNYWTDPVCSPTRAQILTGRHSHHSGVGNIFVPGTVERLGLQHHVATLPTVLRAPGAVFPYQTAAVGKWHLASPIQIGGHSPPHPLGTAAMPWFHRYAGSIDNLTGQSYNAWEKTFATPIDRAGDECTPAAGWSCLAIDLDYATRDTADDAVHLIETLPEPFFLYVAFNAVHQPLGAPATPLTPSACAPGVAGDPVCSSSFDGSDVPRDTRCMMQWLDNEIGRLVCAVEASALKPALPTTLVFTTDNGTRGAKVDFKDGGIVPPFNMKHGKGTLYEGGIHVPLIVASPLIPPSLRGSVHDALVCSTDLFATVANLCSAPLPPDPHGLRESYSIVPYLLGAPGSLRQHVYAELFTENFVPDAQGDPPPSYDLALHRRAVRNVAGFKLIQTVGRDGLGGFTYTEELYDLNADPHEANNLISQITQPAFAPHYVDLRHQLDVVYPHLVTP